MSSWALTRVEPDVAEPAEIRELLDVSLVSKSIGYTTSGPQVDLIVAASAFPSLFFHCCFNGTALIFPCCYIQGLTGFSVRLFLTSGQRLALRPCLASRPWAASAMRSCTGRSMSTASLRTACRNSGVVRARLTSTSRIACFVADLRNPLPGLS